MGFVKIKSMMILIFLLFGINSWSEERNENSESKSGFSFLVKYSYLYNTFNSYFDSANNEYAVTSGNILSGLGLGVSNKYEFAENWAIYSAIVISKFTRSGLNFESNTIPQLSLDIGYKVSDGFVYLGANAQTIMGNTDLTYSISNGGKFGYRFDVLSNSILDVGFDFMVFRSENSKGGINHQKTEMKTLALTYGFKF